MEEGYYFIKHNKTDRLGFLLQEIAYFDGNDWFKINDTNKYSEFDFFEINPNGITLESEDDINFDSNKNIGVICENTTDFQNYLSSLKKTWKKSTIKKSVDINNNKYICLLSDLDVKSWNFDAVVETNNAMDNRYYYSIKNILKTSNFK